MAYDRSKKYYKASFVTKDNMLGPNPQTTNDLTIDAYPCLTHATNALYKNLQ